MGKIIAIVSFCLLLACGGLATLAVIGVKRWSSNDAIVALEKRKTIYEDDAQEFNASLRSLMEEPLNPSPWADNPAHHSIVQFVDDSIAKIRIVEDVPFNQEMFVEAIDASRESWQGLNLLDRIVLSRSFAEYVPIPSQSLAFHRIIGIRMGKKQRTAVADIIHYSYGTEMISERWFLVRNLDATISEQEISHTAFEVDQWQIYDSVDLDFGRRQSDQYGAFLRGSETLSAGFYDAIELINEAQVQFGEGQAAEAIAILEKAENTPMLLQDRDSVHLYAARIYVQFGEPKLAIICLGRIRKPNEMWGVWATLADCQLELRNLDAAQKALKNAEHQSPNHPHTTLLQANIAQRLDQAERAAEGFRKTMMALPENTGYTDQLMAFDRPQDASLLVEMANLEMDPGNANRWVSMANECYSSPAFALLLTAAIQDKPDSPAGIEALLRANAAWGADKDEKAAKLFLQSRDEAEIDAIRQMSVQDHQNLRISNSQYTALFAETDDPERIIASVADWALEEDLHDEKGELLPVLTSFAEKQDGDAVSPTMLANAELVLGYLHLEKLHYEKAESYFQRSLRSLEAIASPEVQVEIDNGDTEVFMPHWKIDFVKSEIQECMIRSKRWKTLIKEFPNDGNAHRKLGDWLTIDATDDQRKEFIATHANNPKDTIKLQALRTKIHNAVIQGNVDWVVELYGDILPLQEEIADSGQDYWGGSLKDQYAMDVVKLKIAPEKFPSKRAILAKRVIEMAKKLGDDVLMNQWFASATGSRDNHVELGWENSVPMQSLAIMEIDVAEAKIKKGDTKAAIEILQHRFSDAFDREFPDAERDEESNADYSYRQGVELLVNALVKDQQWEEASRVLDSIESDASYTRLDIPRRALIDLATGNLESLRKQLDPMDVHEPGTWLTTDPERSVFLANQAEPWYDELLDAYPMPIEVHANESEIRLYFAESSSSQHWQAWGKTNLSKIVSAAIGVSVEIDTDSLEASKAAWLIESERGDRFVVSVNRHKVLSQYAKRLTSRNSSTDKTSSTRLFDVMTIGVLDPRSNQAERMFKLTHHLVASLPNASACYWNDGQLIWSGDHLKDQLLWRDRIPLSSTVSKMFLYSQAVKNDGSELDHTLDSISTWKDRLKENGGSLDVQVGQSWSGGAEWLPATIESIDSASHRIHVTLKADSKLIPYLRNQRSGFVYAYWIRSIPGQ